MAAGSRDDQITNTRQSVEGLLQASHFRTQANDLSEASRDQSRARIIAVAQSGGNTGRKGNDILQSAAQFHAFHIYVGIDAQTGRTLLCSHENILYHFRRCCILTGRNNCRGKIHGNLFRMCRAGESNDLHTLGTFAGCSFLSVSCGARIFFQLAPDHFRHCHQRIRLDSLCNIDDHLAVRNKGPCRRRRGAYENRGYRKQQNILSPADFFYGFRKLKLLRNHHIRQFRMPAACRQLIDLRPDRRPHDHLVPGIAEHPCQCHSPCTRTKYTYLFHSKPPPVYF